MTALVIPDLPHSGLIRFSGDDAQAFLHSQLSCDVAALSTTHSTYGAYCTPKGRVLASFLLWRSDEGLFMQLPASLRQPIQEQLSKFILRSRVKAEDASGARAFLGIAGNTAANVVHQLLAATPKASHDVVHAAGATVLHLPVDRYEITASKDRMALFAEALRGPEKAGPEHWEWLAIRAGIPVVLPATQELFVPQMVNLDRIGGVSFEKGCYPGQEIVARMRYRGTLKQRMYLANLDSKDRPQPGAKLYSRDFGTQACGTIVNAARSPEGGYDLLAVIQIASAENSDVHWNSPDGPALKILPLPYTVT
jgi:folate-binding protein YgfZ